jgi:hypothetical protein
VRERKDIVSFRPWGTTLIGRRQSNEDAPIGMIELTHRDKTVLRQLFGAVGFFKGVLGKTKPRRSQIPWPGDRRCCQPRPRYRKKIGRIRKGVGIRVVAPKHPPSRQPDAAVPVLGQTSEKVFSPAWVTRPSLTPNWRLTFAKASVSFFCSPDRSGTGFPSGPNQIGSISIGPRVLSHRTRHL